MRKARYQWHVKDARTAVLDLGQDEPYTLTFDTPTYAQGKITDDVRTYFFKVEK